MTSIARRISDKMTRARLDIEQRRSRRVIESYFSAPAHEDLVLRMGSNATAPTLADLFTLYGSDKGWSSSEAPPFSWKPHNYAHFYDFLLRSRRDRARIVVECGIGTNNTDVRSNMTAQGRPGASLRAWRDYFPNALIVGLDIDERILFTEERIKTYQVDQLDRRSVEKFWVDSGLDAVDIIIDDGLHTYTAGISLFEAAFSKLTADGIYVIEDVSPERMRRYREYFAERGEVVTYVQLYRDSSPLSSNAMIVIQPTPTDAKPAPG